jgi:hypothetical protein
MKTAARRSVYPDSPDFRAKPVMASRPRVTAKHQQEDSERLAQCVKIATDTTGVLWSIQNHP